MAKNSKPRSAKPRIRKPKGPSTSGDGTLVRKIFFYKVVVQEDPDGSTPVFNAPAALAEINKLAFNAADPTRYLDPGPYPQAMWVTHEKWPCRIQYGTSRRRGLPPTEEAGVVGPLPINDGAGLLDCFHAVFFENGIVGCEFNNLAPRPPRLAEYFMAKAVGLCPNFRLELLLSDDARKQLDQYGELTMITLKAPIDHKDAVKAADAHLGAAFESAEKLGTNIDVEIIIRADRRRGGTLYQKLKSGLRKLAGRESRAQLKRLKVSGYKDDQEKLCELDLLNDKLISIRKIVAEDAKGRSVNSASAYREIEAAYNENKEMIDRIAGV